MDEYRPAPAAAHRQQQQRQGPGRGRPSSGSGDDDVDLPLLPDDVDLEEQRMLMAAIQGGGYEGQLPGRLEGMGQEQACGKQELAWRWHAGRLSCDGLPVERRSCNTCGCPFVGRNQGFKCFMGWSGCCP